MNFIEILLGQLPEALYFAIFIILSKKLKTIRAIPGVPFSNVTLTVIPTNDITINSVAIGIDQ